MIDLFGSNDRIKKLQHWYAVELKKRDTAVEEANKKCDLMMKSAFKRAEEAEYWKDYSKRLEKLNEELKTEIEKHKKKK
jgi:hypothetical protein